MNEAAIAPFDAASPSGQHLIERAVTRYAERRLASIQAVLSPGRYP